MTHKATIAILHSSTLETFVPNIAINILLIIYTITRTRVIHNYAYLLVIYGVATQPLITTHVLKRVSVTNYSMKKM